MDNTVEYLTVIKTAVAEHLMDHNVPVDPETVVPELKSIRKILDDEIKTLEGQIADSK